MVNVPTFVDIPIFGGGSSRIQPSPTVYAAGYLPGQAYPAENHNFFLNGLTDNGVTEQESIISLVTEFTNFLAAYSVAPDPLLFNQFLTTFQAQQALKAPIANPTFTGTVTIPTVPAPTTGGNPTTKTYVDTALALKANLASPALTGNPTAPTQTPLSSNTRLATTAYADLAVAVETARATAAEALLAPKASPAFTGTPTAPTQVSTDDSTKIATTEFVNDVVLTKRLLINIGDWNMDTTATKTVAIGSFQPTSIRGIQVIIRDDNDAEFNDLAIGIETSTNLQGGYRAVRTGGGAAITIAMARLTGGYFDSTSFDSTSFNRGFILLEYL